jgi:ubiquinone/menaquinone biosynthesis C-methylase UbiE
MNKKGLLKNAHTILDFSCGKGDLIFHISQYLTKKQIIIGIDISSESITATIARNISNPNFKAAFSISTWPGPISDNSQDLVFATEVIEHLTNEEVTKVLAECLRVLKPGGRLFLTTPNDENLDSEKTLCPECGCIFHRWQHMQSWKHNQLTSSLKENGFRVVECAPILWGPWPAKFYFWLTGKKYNGLYAIATATKS